MSTESVSILIEADDKASKTFAESAQKIAASQRKVEQVLKSIESPIDRYNKELAELQELQRAGSLNADQFAAAQGKIKEKLEGTGNAVKEVGGKAKASAEFVGILANMAGGSEIAGFAGQLGQMTEKVGQFSEVSKLGGAGALAFKGGVLALAFGLGVTLGKALGDVIFQTAKFNREMERTKELASSLSSEMINLYTKTIELEKRDIELIRDPEKKSEAYASLFNRLENDVQAVTAQIEASKKTLDEYADSWQMFKVLATLSTSNVSAANSAAALIQIGERKALADMAEAELANDKERLKAAKAQRDAIREQTSERTKAAEALAAENAAKDKSESYVESLRLELEYMKATREEQIKLDAARNTTAEDRSEAEALLKEKDAILAKAEAERKADEDKKKRQEENAKAVKEAFDAAKQMWNDAQAAAEKIIATERAANEKKRADAEAEIKRVDDIVKGEQQRLELRRIEITQGKEAAKVQSLINQGIDQALAKDIAAKEAAIDKLAAAKNEDKATGKSFESSPLVAAESRLLTRGPGQSVPEQTLAEIRNLRRDAAIAERQRRQDEKEARDIERNKNNIILAGAPV